MNPSFEQTLIDVWRQSLIENANVVELGTEAFPRSSDSQAPLAGSGFNDRRKRDSGAGTKPRYKIPLGKDGALWHEGHAISQRGALRNGKVTCTGAIARIRT